MSIDKKFWVYELCQSYEIKPELFENYKIKGRIFDDAQFFFDQMGTAAHPSFRNNTCSRENQTELTNFSCINSRIDQNTIKILIFLLPYTKIVSLKFCSNLFELSNFDLLIDNLVTKQNNIFFFAFEWNDQLIRDEEVYDREKYLLYYEAEKQRLERLKKLEEEKEKEKEKEKTKKGKKEKNIVEEEKEEIITPEEAFKRNCVDVFVKQNEILKKLFIQTKLEGICFRGDKLGDYFAIELFNILSSPDTDTHLKSLNLFYNKLTSKCIDSFCEMLIKNKIIEEVNLGKNEFTDEDIQKIKEHTGKFPLKPEEVDDYNKRIKERDAQIAKNAKLKSQKKPEVPVEQLDELVQIGDEYFTVKNCTLKYLNLMKNKFTDKCYDNVVFMVEHNDDLKFTLDDNIFTAEHMGILNDKKGKYFGKVSFSKH